MKRFDDTNITGEQAAMHAAIRDYLSEKYDGWTLTIVDRWFPLTELPEGRSFVGSFSISNERTRQRWIQDKYAIDLDGLWVTPTDLSRRYLVEKFGKRPKLRCSTKQYEQTVAVNQSPPLYAIPGRGKGRYLDLSGAYWQILKRFGWNVDYFPGRFLCVRSHVRDYPYYDHKMARNTLVSLGQGKGFMVWDSEYGGMRAISSGNRFYNRVLWSCVCDVLNGVALDLIEMADAQYVYTDGYIIPDNRLLEAALVFEEWGLDYRIKGEGEYHIKAPGNYIIGGVASRPYATGKRERTVAKISARHKDWLRERSEFFSRKQLDDPPKLE